MNQENNHLVPLNITTELARSPRASVQSLLEFNRKAYDFFATERVLTAINEKFFNSKGTIEKPYSFYGIDLETSPKPKGKKSRFDTYLSATGELRYTSLRATLTVKGADLSEKNKKFDTLKLAIYYEIESQENTFTIQVEGELGFVVNRWEHRGGNWGPSTGDVKSFYLKKTGEARSMTLPLDSPPQPHEILVTLGQNFQQILEGFAAQGYIKLPEPPPPNSPEQDSQAPLLGE